MKDWIFNRVFWKTIFSLLLMGLCVASANANTRLVVVDDTDYTQQKSGLSLIAKEAFSSRLSQMNFLVMDTESVLNKTVTKTTNFSKNNFTESLPNLRTAYGEIIIVFFKLELFQSQQYNSKLQANVSVYSSASETSLISTSLEEANILLPKECDNICTRILASRATREIGDILASRVGKLIKSLSSANSKEITMLNAVKFELLNFTNSQKNEFIEILENELPGFHKIENMQTKASLSRFIYYTEISNYKLERWISIGLEEIGIFDENNFEISVKPGNIQVLLIKTQNKRGSTGNPLKYN